MTIIKSIVWILAAAACTALILPIADAETITHDISLALNPSQLQSDRWSPNSQLIPNTSLSEGDTLRLNIDFQGNGLRWTDNGAEFEYLVFGLWTASNSAALGIRSDVSISLTNATGDINVADFAGSANGNGIAISGNTLAFGFDDITDGVLDFTGLSIEFANLVGRGLPDGSGLPEIFNRFSLAAIGGEFAITGETSPVPIPAAAVLFPSGLLAGLAWMRRRERPTRA